MLLQYENIKDGTHHILTGSIFHVAGTMPFFPPTASPSLIVASRLPSHTFAVVVKWAASGKWRRSP